MRILITYGTRPEYIKVLPLIDVCKKYGISVKTLFTGQHKDLVGGNSDHRWMMIGEAENRLNSVMINCLKIPSSIFDDIDAVLVQGDTSSVLGMAISAYNHRKKVIHLEAGLRTYDTENPWPEESNRRMVSQITNIHLCPTSESAENLKNEKVLGEIHIVGNTALDNLLKYKDKCKYTNKILVTLHRRENHPIMKEWFNEINEVASWYPEFEFVFPMHPNPDVQKHKGLLTSRNIKIIEPLPHNKLMKLLTQVTMVITDSGGLQEEASFFNKKCLTCRVVTERPEAIGQSTILIPTPADLKKIFVENIDKPEIDFECPFGDGYASEKIAKILKG